MLKKIPYILSILGMIGGIFIAILFGADESILKDRISRGLEKNVKIQSIQDPVKIEETVKAEKDKSWRYYQRYHFHANGVSSMSLALLILLAFIKTSKRENYIVAYLISIGGVLYPFIWFFAALYGPEIGREEAKEAFRFFGYMGGVYFVGVAYFLYLAFAKKWREPLN